MYGLNIKKHVCMSTIISIAAAEISSKWASGFQPRSSTEHVRNCSLVAHDVKALVVRRLTDALLTMERYLPVQCVHNVREKSARRESLQWNCGGPCVRVCVSITIFESL